MRRKWFAGVWGPGLLGLPLLTSSHAKLSAKPAALDEPAILVGAGDIADCRDLSGAEATAKLLEQIPGTVMAVGDLAYPDGSRENFQCYDRTWGRANSYAAGAGQSRVSRRGRDAVLRLLRRSRWGS